MASILRRAKAPGGHGALIDARILAEVYLQLKGGREQRLAFDAGEAASTDAAVLRPVAVYAPRAARQRRCRRG